MKSLKFALGLSLVLCVLVLAVVVRLATPKKRH